MIIPQYQCHFSSFYISLICIPYVLSFFLDVFIPMFSSQVSGIVHNSKSKSSVEQLIQLTNFFSYLCCSFFQLYKSLYCWNLFDMYISSMWCVYVTTCHILWIAMSYGHQSVWYACVTQVKLMGYLMPKCWA